MSLLASLQKGFDAYELRARLFPGLLLLAPVVVFLSLILGPKNPIGITLGSVLIACGGPYLLSSLVRTFGQRAQDKLYRKWGAQPSTILLRHSDHRLPAETKKTYHQLIEQKLGISVPSAEEELNNLAAADSKYSAAANALRPLTVDQKKFALLFKELVAYGFVRNAHGVRWIGLLINLATIFATLISGGVVSVANADVQYASFQALSTAHILTLVAAVVFLFIWLFYFSSRTVEQAGFSYAYRLWETLSKVSKIKVTG